MTVKSSVISLMEKKFYMIFENKWIENIDWLIKNIHLVKFLFIPLTAASQQIYWYQQHLLSLFLFLLLTSVWPVLRSSTPTPHLLLSPSRSAHRTIFIAYSQIPFAFLKVSQHLFFPFSTARRIPFSKGKWLSPLCWLVLLQGSNIFIGLTLRRKCHKLYLSLTNAFLALTLRLRN